ncbi:MAG TPA: zinc-ribbon domain-containing protein [Polyangiaceae bacterium]|nr:zinc-ribbon domain-containing protein [Polyangiaceae bacterium]HYQ30291.1 zinc-ribbon domain-containing protein [Polyangiaceae bacterium]
MIIVCNSCSAQYSVSDAKVRGKLVRITCKHCSTAIVVDGRQMSEVEVTSQKPLASYALPRRDESVVAAMPQSMAPARPSAASPPAHAATSSPLRAPVSAPLHSAMSAEMREEDQTMIARSRFGDEMSVHDERTVIGQIPKEALEFERMFAQRTQPPPPEEAGPANTASTAPPPAQSELDSRPLPSFSSDAPPPNATDERDSGAPNDSEDAESSGPQSFSRSEPPTVGQQPSSDSRGLVTLAEATHPSVARSVSARRLRVTLIALLVVAVLVILFVIKMPR